MKHRHLVFAGFVAVLAFGAFGAVVGTGAERRAAPPQSPLAALDKVARSLPRATAEMGPLRPLPGEEAVRALRARLEERFPVPWSSPVRITLRKQATGEVLDWVIVSPDKFTFAFSSREPTPAAKDALRKLWASYIPSNKMSGGLPVAGKFGLPDDEVQRLNAAGEETEMTTTIKGYRDSSGFYYEQHFPDELRAFRSDDTAYGLLALDGYCGNLGVGNPFGLAVARGHLICRGLQRLRGNDTVVFDAPLESPAGSIRLWVTASTSDHTGPLVRQWLAVFTNGAPASFWRPTAYATVAGVTYASASVYQAIKVGVDGAPAGIEGESTIRATVVPTTPDAPELRVPFKPGQQYVDGHDRQMKVWK